MLGIGMNNLLELFICVNIFDNLSELSVKVQVESCWSFYFVKGYLIQEWNKKMEVMFFIKIKY